jgi:arylsulfatase A-like enzyme
MMSLLWVGIACDPPEKGNASAVLITLDTTRWNGLSCYGAPPGVTPHLDRIAGEGIAFDRARTVTPLTLPSHASMLTGLYPIRHLARDNSMAPLPESAVTLAERAADRGLETAAFVAATVVGSGLGMDQGFHHFSQPPVPTRSSVTTQFPERKADEVAAEVVEWIAGRQDDRPFFLWVHFFDPHHPYEPPAHALRAARGNPYLGEIAFMDQAIGRVRAALEDAGMFEDTLVAVVADHGEGLGQHGEATHGALCYDSTMRVPMLLRYPDGFRAGERSSEVVSVVDIYPTLLEAMGLGEPGDVDGLSLYRREVPEGRGVYFESYYGYREYGWSPIAGWADARGKYLHGTTPEFFLTEEDPEETRDRAPEKELLAPYVEALRRVSNLETLTADGSVDPDTLASLRALGYVASGAGPAVVPGPLEPPGLPDARPRHAELRRLDTAFALGEQGRFDEAIVELRAVVADNPRNTIAMQWLSTYLIHRQRCAEAVPILQQLLDRGAVTGSTHNNLGHCLPLRARARSGPGQPDPASQHRPGEEETGRPAVTRPASLRCSTRCPGGMPTRRGRSRRQNRRSGPGDGAGGWPRCSRARLVATRPRGVRSRNPIWSRYGS